MLNVTLDQKEGITESSYEQSTDSMVNKVAIYNSKNKRIGTVSNKIGLKHMEHFRIPSLLIVAMERKRLKIHCWVWIPAHH